MKNCLRVNKALYLNPFIKPNKTKRVGYITKNDVDNVSLVKCIKCLRTKEIVNVNK